MFMQTCSHPGPSSDPGKRNGSQRIYCDNLKMQVNEEANQLCSSLRAWKERLALMSLPFLTHDSWLNLLCSLLFAGFSSKFRISPKLFLKKNSSAQGSCSSEMSSCPGRTVISQPPDSCQIAYGLYDREVWKCFFSLLSRPDRRFQSQTRGNGPEANHPSPSVVGASTFEVFNWMEKFNRITSQHQLSSLIW